MYSVYTFFFFFSFCCQCAAEMSLHFRRADKITTRVRKHVVRENSSNLLSLFFFSSLWQRRKLTWWLWCAVPPAPPLCPHRLTCLSVSRRRKKSSELSSVTTLRSSCNTTMQHPVPPHRLLHPLLHPTSAQEGVIAHRATTTLLAALLHLHPRHGIITTRPGTRQRLRMRRSGGGRTMWWSGSGAMSWRTASCACGTTCPSSRTMTRHPRWWSWRRLETVSMVWKMRATDCNQRGTNLEPNRKSWKPGSSSSAANGPGANHGLHF